ncbi:hypothetical protein R5W24_003340 [Gemmata sp. JC717]|uniref:hypothetical protein n=1 Tax=Gemmata algarum TaxID=2975278 RepID=UPI0021BB7D07|nr:hypothetical protein [Gemmata algarum]MDY3554221.1 hypothetical protein [Gemmata algarum]
MTDVGHLSLKDAAEVLAGNWLNFQSFSWPRWKELDDPSSWAVVYTHNRDSGLLELSNAAVIARKLEPHTEGDDPDVTEECHSHFLHGYLDGYSIRVFRGGEITEAIRVYHALQERFANYPILSESDYSQREHDATIKNIEQAAHRLKHEYRLPEGWESDVYCWLSDHTPRAVENRDDHGGSPTEDDLRQAFDALGYESHGDGE